MKLTKENIARQVHLLKYNTFDIRGTRYTLLQTPPALLEESELCKLTELLIKEHYDNQPLKIEELEEDMWVWDNKEKMFCKILEVLPSNKLSMDYHYENILNFEENRFYRKEVAEWK